jgi:hypothetical protein
MARSLKSCGAGPVRPGADRRRGKCVLGRRTHLLDANEILWDTLSRRRRPEAPRLPAPDAAP